MGKQMIILLEELELTNQHRDAASWGSPWSHVRAGKGDGGVGRFWNRVASRGRGPHSLPVSRWQGGRCPQARESFLPTNSSTVSIQAQRSFQTLWDMLRSSVLGAGGPGLHHVVPDLIFLLKQNSLNIHGDEEGLRSVASILRTIKGVYQVMARAVLTHRERCIYYHIFLK